MFRILTAVSALALITACSSGQPFDFGDTEDATDQTTDDTTGTTDEEAAEDTSILEVGTDRPDGSRGLSPTGGILRREARDNNGGGLVSSASYNAADDTFLVDNLGFDGANIYNHDIDNAVRYVNGYAAFEADVTTLDSLTGDPITQIRDYRAILGTSTNSEGDEARTSFAIVRTGGYVNYGFGGFIYERNGAVTLPTTGQATFSGDYAGIRVFDNLGRLEYTTGDMRMDIDFEDFNANDAVKGYVTGRTVFDIDGDEIGTLPVLSFTIQEGSPSITENGEVSGEIFSTTVSDTGTLEIFEEGNYYGIIAGDATDSDDGGEIVGVIVIESIHPDFETNVQETGGFILYR